MAQTKLGSMAEVGLNLLVGYTVNFLANLLILPMFGFATLTVAKNLEIGVLFTIVSIARQYIIRRFFQRFEVRQQRGEGMSLFPEDDKARKAIPLFRYLTRYFPKAHREVTKVCVVNNVRYNPTRKPTDINWARSKSPDQMGSAFRHMMESEVDGKVFEEVPADIAERTGIDKVYVLAEAMWRLGAELELTIEREEALAELAKEGQQRVDWDPKKPVESPFPFELNRDAGEC